MSTDKVLCYTSCQRDWILWPERYCGMGFLGKMISFAAGAPPARRGCGIISPSAPESGEETQKALR
ncbi:MAG: hypothetical protein R2839_00315 [Thermomicrobiales bacterium]